jgi:hypothetical protein
MSAALDALASALASADSSALRGITQPLIPSGPEYAIWRLMIGWTGGFGPDQAVLVRQAVRAIGGKLFCGQISPTLAQTLRSAGLEFDHAGISTREFLLGILDKKIASATEIEPYYAPFFSYLLQSDNHDSKGRDGEDWAIRFNQECPLVARAGNPFNKTKFTGLVKRWYSYSGHGWEDPSGTFQPNPYGRVKRSLPDIFGRKLRLSADDFMANLALHCPELDGGAIFMNASPQHDPKFKKLTLGLSHALVDLHSDNVIQLNCPVDSRGWSIEAAQPPVDGNLMHSSRIDHVEYAR